MSSSSKRIAVVSGATGYLGFEIARKLAADGVRIAFLYHSKSDDAASRMLSELPGEGHRAFVCDLSNKEQIDQVIKKIEAEMGDMSACIHAAATPPKLKQLHSSPVSDIEEEFRVNVFGAFNFLSACALKLKEHRQGVLIGITTAAVATSVNTKTRGAYGVGKFALQGILTAFKEELLPYGVRVYSVAPGFMEGGINSSIPRAFAEMVRSISPTRRITNAEEVAKRVALLCSDEVRNADALTIVIAPETDTE